MSKSKPCKSGPRTDNTEKAIILSHAATFGVAAAAKQFGVNRKTIQRYRVELDSGTNPELSKLVAAEKEQSAKRNRSKMQRALDVLLDRVIDTAPTATITEATGSIEKIGELYGSWKVMGVKPDSEGEEAPSNEGLGGSGKGKPGLRAVG
jgi:DNA-binding phage protein